jgi:hypothetical protein
MSCRLTMGGLEHCSGKRQEISELIKLPFSAINNRGKAGGRIATPVRGAARRDTTGLRSFAIATFTVLITVGCGGGSSGSGGCGRTSS